jgi:DNA replication ATP-dependent helicase Dna2
MLLQLPQDTPAWLRAASTAEPTLVWLDTSALPDAREHKRLSGFCNHTEVALCKAVVDMMLRLGVPSSDMGVTSPYVQQVASLQRSLFQSGRDEMARMPTETAGAVGEGAGCAAVMTIDRCQGQDKAAMLVSLVRSNAEKHTGDLLQDNRRMNVALTRAKHKVVIVGDASTVSQVPFLKKVLDVVGRLGKVFQLDAEDLQGVL